jgi:hypothetical protein
LCARGGGAGLGARSGYGFSSARISRSALTRAAGVGDEEVGFDVVLLDRQIGEADLEPAFSAEPRSAVANRESSWMSQP